MSERHSAATPTVSVKVKGSCEENQEKNSPINKNKHSRGEILTGKFEMHAPSESASSLAK